MLRLGFSEDPAFTVRYTRPTTNPLKDLRDRELKSFPEVGQEIRVRNVNAASAQRLGIQGRSMTMRFDGPLNRNTGANARAFSVATGAQGAPLSAVAVEKIAVAGADRRGGGLGRGPRRHLRAG